MLGRDFAYPLLRDVAEADEASAASSLGSACRRRPPVCRGRAAAGQLSLQARADPGRGLREPAQEPPPGAAPPRGRGVARARTPSPKRSPIISPRPVSTISPIEWWGKAGDQALRRSAFQEAIAHLGKAIEMADKAAAAASRRGAEDVATSSQRMKLQSDYSQAMMWSKGFAAEETKAAFARAAELAGRTDDFSERFAALQGQWAAAVTGGELRSARELALTLLREAEDAGRVTEAGIGQLACSAWSISGMEILLRRGPIASGRSTLATRTPTRKVREWDGTSIHCHSSPRPCGNWARSNAHAN